AGLSVTIAPGRYSPKGEGRVLQMDPRPGTTVDRSSVVTLIPSLGPPPVPVPDLSDLTLAKARDALKQAHLNLGEVTREYSDTVAVDHVIRQSQQAASKVPRRSGVDVVLSKGPTPQPVPRVIGKTEDQARSLLQDWVVQLETRFSDTVPKGHVITQHPDPKIEVQPGEDVTIVVSLGPQTFPMPNVYGLSKDAAIARLRALGLKVAVSPLPGSPGTTVGGQLPLPGTIVKYGQTVTIYV
ncbi:MAG TPA: PASTA domain-containing protein, partial [Actinomycetota bacterium]|nr:PASTA domain-containing protein [Actinomycetota bacterium]